ncbi:MAG: CDP-paratose synthetase [Bacteriovoracaceae bacterium]|jgi:CDP-paratose synthetase
MQLNEINPGARKVLLTGGTGFLGSHIARFYKAKGDELTILKRSSSNLNKISDLALDVKLVNIEDFDGGQFDLVIHTASSYGRNGEDLEEVTRANIDFPIELLNKLNHDQLHFINIGTSLPENVNEYARTKHAFIKKARKSFPNLKFSNLIAEQFYGPHDGTFISFIINKLKENVDHLPLTKGDQSRDFIYFEDVINAIATLEELSEGGDFPVGTGKTLKIKEVVELIAKELKSTTTRLDFGGLEYREQEVMSSVADTKKLEKMGWSARYDFVEGLRKTLENW